jgi:hypothetical protein
MLNWLFKKPARSPAPRADAPPARPAPVPVVQPRPRPPAPPEPDWSAQLQAAQGNDEALLQLARSTSRLPIKIAAVEALGSEQALKLAEREFRDHDRKVHRLAKQRLEAAVARRVARVQAQALIERTQVLIDDAELPLNHLVDLDRQWQALPAEVLEPAQVEAFTAQRQRLDAAVRERSEQQQRLQRWLDEARRALPEWQRALRAAAEQGAAVDAVAAATALQALLDARPAGSVPPALEETLQRTRQSALWVEARLRALEASSAAAAESIEVSEDPVAPSEGNDAAGIDEDLVRVLTQRCDAASAAISRSRRKAEPPPPAPEVVAPPPPRADPARAELRQRVDGLLEQAEAALAEGQLAAMQQHLLALDAVLEPAVPGALSDRQRGRLQALRAERSRLADWQRWGGTRARDDLVAEAEQLGRETLAAVEAQPTPARKLNLKAHGDRIQALRKRWKEVDRHGAPASQEQWQRFDAALQVAHQPVAAQHAALKAARQENLAARIALLEPLEAITLPEPGVEGAPTWKDLLRELDAFRLAWRRLGPLEHTVPAEARQALQQRTDAAVGRLEAPLLQVRSAAAAEREQLVQRAEQLQRDIGPDTHPGEVARQVRDLQAAWQDHARRLPLARALEATLWARFRAAIDAVFAQREAAFAERDAELAARVAAREALLQRLTALDGTTPMADLERTLAEVDRAWRQDAELPRDAVASLDARYRSARAAAAALLAAAQRQRWQELCDTLAARLALCEERGSGAADGAELESRWTALGRLPSRLEQALARRWAQPADPGPLSPIEQDDWLLRLEAALELPVTPEQQAARHQFKLRALKDTLEGRTPAPQGSAPLADGLSALLRQADLDAPRRRRLHALLAALRVAPPGALGLPTQAG